MAKVKPGDGSMGAVIENPPEGWGLFEFTGNEVNVVGADKDCLQFDLDFVDNPNCKARIWAKYGNDSGQRKLLDIIIRSGVWKKMMKKYPDKCNYDASVEGIDDVVLTNGKFHQQLVHELEGCRVRCKIVLKKEMYKDEERTKANVVAVDYVNNKPTESQSSAVPRSASLPQEGVKAEEAW